MTIYCVAVVRLQRQINLISLLKKMSGPFFYFTVINIANHPVFKINRLGFRIFIVEVSLGLRLFHVMGCIDSHFL